jgi:biopolymer transport protein ExbD
MAQSIRKIAGDEAVHYVPPRKKRGRGKTKMQPPLTPMIDVTFQLLLFFLLATTFREAEGQIPSVLPKTQGVREGPKVDAKPVKVEVAPSLETVDGVIYRVGTVQVETPQDLFVVLYGRKQSLGGAQDAAVIQPRADVPWRFVMEAYNQATRAKFEQIAFAPST